MGSLNAAGGPPTSVSPPHSYPGVRALALPEASHPPARALAPHGEDVSRPCPCALALHEVSHPVVGTLVPTPEEKFHPYPGAAFVPKCAHQDASRPTARALAPAPEADSYPCAMHEEPSHPCAMHEAPSHNFLTTQTHKLLTAPIVLRNSVVAAGLVDSCVSPSADRDLSINVHPEPV